MINLLQQQKVPATCIIAQTKHEYYYYCCCNFNNNFILFSTSSLKLKRNEKFNMVAYNRHTEGQTEV